MKIEGEWKVNMTTIERKPINIPKEQSLIVCAIYTCPDGTVLRSSGGLFASHVDKTDGWHYYIDCTQYYIRSSIPKDKGRLVIITTDDQHEIVRENVEWTSFGVKGDEPPKRRAISKLDTEHIRQIIKTQHHIQKQIKQCFINELQYRKENNLE